MQLVMIYFCMIKETGGYSTLQFLIGILVVVIYSGFTFYIGWNLNLWLASIKIHIPNLIFWPILYLAAFGFVLGRIHEYLRPLSIIGNYWMFVFEYGLILCIIANIVVFITPLTARTTGSVAVLIFIVLFIYGTYNAYSPVVRETTIKMNVDQPMKVVLASDFHLGVLSNKVHLQRFVTLSNEQNPDVVLLAGDLVDDKPDLFIKKNMGEVMAQLKSTYGVYGVLGNHEYYGNAISEIVDELEKANVKMLMDETILVGERFYLTGQEDKTNKARKVIADLAPVERDKPWIVMNHTPDDLNSPMEAGVNLHVSGHTHLGQLWPNNFITDKVFELDYGYKNKERMHALVSSGFGFWGPPMRIGSQSELWVIHIEPN